MPQVRGAGRRLRPPRERFHFPAQGCPRARLPPAVRHRTQALRQHPYARRRSVRHQRAGSARPQSPGPEPGTPERSGTPRRPRPVRGSARQRRPPLSHPLLPCCPFHRTGCQQRRRPEHRHPPSPAGAGALPASYRPPVRRYLLLSSGLPAWQPRSFPPFPPQARTGSPAPQVRGPGRRLPPPRERFRSPAQGCPQTRLPPAVRHRTPALRQHP